MSEYAELVSKLKEQQGKLLAVVTEAESKVAEYTRALNEGREHLRRVEARLKIFDRR